MLILWLFLPGITAYSKDLAWYASSSRSLSTDPSVFVAKTAIDLCTLSPDLGGCGKELVRYYYDQAADECKRFLYTGCGGNSNRFMRRTHCRSRCVKHHQKHLIPEVYVSPNLEHKEIKHRRTLTTTTTTTLPSTTTIPASTKPLPVTPETSFVQKVPIPSSIKQCPYCDPLFGVCVDGECGCISGFKKLGRICIDINECEKGDSACPVNSRCTNTVGSFRCDCDAGFDSNGDCKIQKDACTDPFDFNLAEEDCNDGKLDIRYYFDNSTASCRQFHYGGCQPSSRNIFKDIQDCNSLCMSSRQESIERDDSRTIPTRIVFDVATTTPMTLEEKKEEATKIVRIMQHINPNENPCSRPFDEDLREECVLAHWEERFYWNPVVRECEPFWYDATCDPRRPAGKNFFETLKHCQTKCSEEMGSPEEENDVKISDVKNMETTLRLTALTTSSLTMTTLSDPLHFFIKTTTATAPVITTTTAEPNTPTPVEESNFAPKTAVTKFDRKKYMEEFRRKLNSLPDDFAKKPQDSAEVKTTRSSFTFAFSGENRKGELDASLFKEVTPVLTTMLERPKKTTQDPLDLSKFVTKRPPFTLNPHIFGEIVDTGREKPEENEKSKEGRETTTPNPLDLSKFKTKRPPFVIYISDIQQHSTQATTSAPTVHTTTFGKSGTTHDPLDLSKFVTKRPRFTLDPALFKDLETTAATTTGSGPTFEKIYKTGDLERHRYDVFTPVKQDRPIVSHPDVELQMPEKRIVTKAPPKVFDFATEEKEKISNLIDEMNKSMDLCEEPLHPTLEEDCSGEQWVLQWFFNADLGSCKSFWYGGCPTEARNFFKTHGLCKVACAHKIPSAEGNFNPHYIMKGDTTTTMTTRRPPTTEGPAIERSFKQIKEMGEQVFIPVRSGEVDEPKEKKLRYVTLPPTTTMAPIVLLTTEESAEVDDDPCDNGYDEEWDSDCSGDNWMVRSYFDSKTKSCKRFWWGGCSTKNRNIWKDKQDCLTQCAHKMKEEEHRPITEAPAAYGTVEPPSNMIDVFELPTASALVGDRSLNHPQSDTIVSRKSRKNRHKLNLKWNVVQTTYEVEQAPTSTYWGTQNDAPVSSHEDERPAFATKDRFEADLQKRLGNDRRHQEGRRDLLYSAAVGHPVTIASECLEPFDPNLARSCNNGSIWTNRYYFDPDLRTCRMFWSDGCEAYNKNNFPDSESCQWKCEGRHPEPERAKACLEPFDTYYLEDCSHGDYGNRFYFDFSTKRCAAFHWGGCRSESRNFFTDLGDCQETCEAPPRHLTQSCIEPFDDSYKDSCSADGRYVQYYYFDHVTHSCKMFWYGNCKGEGQNFYPTLETCQWICERHRQERAPSYCMDQFDVKYTESCGEGRWTEKWKFDHNFGECQQFWWDDCTSTSQNIFPNEKMCKNHCVNPGHLVESKLPDPETKYRCLDPVEIGNCRETYPAFYYDRSDKKCKPFAYSGCGGNGNRFMTITQCENLCSAFEDISEPEMDCHLPLHLGHGQNDPHCLETAGYHYYFDRDYGRCTQFWYMGCGGNANNFYSYDVCMRTCRVEKRRLERRPRASSTACYKPAAVTGQCPSKLSRPVQRWTYHNMKCATFMYTGCGGNENRFSTEIECKETCANHKPSADPVICSFEPEAGSCNQLRYKWFYNQTRGTCDQFLYGGCDGNPNRFDTFEECQKKCEVSGLDPCMESLDRGNWCEAMSNRYYFNKKSKQCRGFHYTGCGKSGNNFLTAEECHTKCELRYPKKRAAAPKASSSKKKIVPKTGYSGVKPPLKTAMIRHIELNGVNKTYYKSTAEWIDYGLCLGYRYNISGRDTVLQVHLCSHDGDSACYSDSFQSTEGEEFCQILRPFMRGTHLYTWYFALDLKHPAAIENGSGQRDSVTTASILQLKANHCHDIC